jgi:hypothetical protein
VANSRSPLASLSTIPGPVETARAFWLWLRRMRTALYLLGLVGLATLIATLVPQMPNVPDTVERWLDGTEGPGTAIAEIFLVLGLYDVYGSPWFKTVLVLLFTSLTACLIPRYRAYIRLVRRGVPPQTRAPERKQRIARLTTTRAPADSALRPANRAPSPSLCRTLAQAGGFRCCHTQPTVCAIPPRKTSRSATGADNRHESGWFEITIRYC